MTAVALFRVSLSWPALAVAAALAAGPALAAGAVPSRPGEPVEHCFDPESVVFGAKPHRDPEATARRGGGQAAQGQAAAKASDARPILTLVMERPRDCKAPPDWDSVSAPSSRPGMLDGERSDGFDTPLHARPVAAAQGGRADDMALPARAAPLADSAIFADPVHPEGPPAGGFTVGAGFLPSGPVRGVAVRAAVGAFDPPNTGFPALAIPQGAASPAPSPPDASSTDGDLPLAPAAKGGIAAVPEPSTWTLLVLSFFGLGAALRQGRTPPALGRAI